MEVIGHPWPYHPRWGNPRSVSRVLGAASRVRTSSLREACVLGGVVSSILRYGTVAKAPVVQSANELMALAYKLSSSPATELPDKSPPRDVEVTAAIQAFEREYKDDGQGPVPA